MTSIKDIVARNDWLEERVYQLEQMLGAKLVVPPAWCLRPKEAQLFGLLLTRQLVTREGALTAIYCDQRLDDPDPKLIDVMLSYMRKKLAPYDIEIRTVSREGWYLDRASKERARELIEREFGAVAA